MTTDQMRETVLRVLGQIAPEADLVGLDASATLREELDLDSMDFLNFALGLHDATGLDIPERDYPRLATLDGCLTYLMGRTGCVASR